MLFDLRGKGRRRTVQVIYVGLAILIGLGLVGFGIGGGFGGGGLFTAATNNEGANKSSFASEIKRYEKLTKQQPTNAAAWEKLTLAQLHEAGGEAYVQNGHLTSKGRELFTGAAASWRAYLALNPPAPSVSLARNVSRIFSEEGLNEPSAEVQVLQIVAAAHPTDQSFAELAAYAYKAKNIGVADLAAAKALSLAPASQRKQLALELKQLKEHPNGASESTAKSESGQTFNVKTSPSGKITAVPTGASGATGASGSSTAPGSLGATGTTSAKK